MIKKFSAWLLYQKMGWKFDGRIPLEEERLMIVFLPHTSNWDFIIGMLIVKAEQLTITLFGKDAFYFWPLTWCYRYFNVVPINRKVRSNFVEQAARSYAKGGRLWTAMAPEGTRSQINHLKSGYYYLARKADVPILVVGLDFEHKTLVIQPPRPAKASFDEDADDLIEFSRRLTGKRPALSI